MAFNQKYSKMSKSKFMSGEQCPKRLWMEKHAKENASPMTDKQNYIINQGQKIGELARDEYPNGILIKSDNLHPTDALAETALALNNGVEILYEPAFLFNECFTRIDILRKLENNRWEIIEVKGSIKIKDEHISDIAIQQYVVENNGLNVVKSSLMCINKQSKSTKFENLFEIHNVSDQINNEIENIEGKLHKYKLVLSSAECPDISVGGHCKKPYDCQFIAHCWKDIPNTTIHNVPYLKGAKLHKLIDAGITDIKNIPDGFPLTENQQNYVNIKLNNNPEINIKAIEMDLNKLKYPIHFLDFETHNPALPKYDGFRPFTRIPFQFSCHILYRNNELEHKEYLAIEDADPRQTFLQQLIKAIEKTGSIMVYSIGFERGILLELASHFPSYQVKLNNIIDRFWDLRDIFKYNYKHPDFSGSNSIKDILPVLIPGQSYEKLDLNKGDTAGIYWERMLNSNNDVEREKLKQSLIEYCSLDTFAMFEIFQHLTALAAENIKNLNMVEV